MNGSLTICTIPDELKQELKDFRFKKSSSTNVIILKIDRADQVMKIEDRFENCSFDELQAELPNQQPRFIVLNYLLKHSDGRVSYPLCLIFYTPLGCSTELQILYAGSRNYLVKECEFTKCFEIRDIEEISDEYLISKLL